MQPYAKNTQPLPRQELPEPVFPENPPWVDFYWRAWELAWDHVVHKPGAPQSPYMDEAFDPNIIWIWDTCFMVHFCKYAPHVFPGIQSFDNFYGPLHHGRSSTLAIQHPDNPPLFAWTEETYLRFTGDRQRLQRLITGDASLLRHYAFIEAAQAGQTLPGTICPLAAQKTPYGYHWNGISSGMDNTPRGRDQYDRILWFDLLAQQGLAADRIATMATMIGETGIAADFRSRHAELRALANRYYWSAGLGTYCDILADDPRQQVPIKTPAAYWGMLAGFCDEQQAAAMARLAEDPQHGFGGDIPWPSITRDDPDYRGDGEYWRGGVWLPMVYMATCALRDNGFASLADQLAERVLAHMVRTWQTFKPATIWEAYSPTQPSPCSDKVEFAGQLARPDFCGWSALGPISLFIESVLGFHHADAQRRELHWNRHRSTLHGIRRLRFGDILTDVWFDGSRVHVNSNAPYSLVTNGRTFAVEARQGQEFQSV